MRVTGILSILLLMLVFSTGMFGCAETTDETATPTSTATPTRQEGQVTPFELTSTAFVSGQPIPHEYTCDGANISPPLQWSNAPQGTVSLALIVDDPDAPGGTWVHWVIYNLTPEMSALPKNVAPDVELPDGSRQGRNSWGSAGYGGPCPPGGTHRYFFKLYALDSVLEPGPGASSEQLLEAMEGHILSQAELMGLYSSR